MPTPTLPRVLRSSVIEPLSRGAQRNDRGACASLTQKLRGAVRHRIGGGQQHRVGAMDVPTGDRPPFMSDQRGDSRLTVAEIRGERGERVPQHVGGYVRRQPGELGNAGPEFLEVKDGFSTTPR